MTTNPSLTFALAMTLAGMSPVRMILPAVAEEYDGVFFSNDGYVINLQGLAEVENLKLSPVMGQLFDTIQKENFSLPSSVDQEQYFVVTKDISKPNNPRNTYSLVISGEVIDEDESAPLVIPLDVWKYTDGDLSVNPSYNNRTSVIIPDSPTNIEEVCKQALYVLSTVGVELENSPSVSFASMEAHQAYRRQLRNTNRAGNNTSVTTVNSSRNAGSTGIPLQMEQVPTLNSPQIFKAEDVELANPFITEAV